MTMRISPRLFLVPAFAVALAVATSCSKNSSSTSPQSGTMMMQLTDAAFSTDSVQSADIFVVRVDGRAAAADSTAAATDAADDSASMNGWITLAKPNQSINLMAYQNGATLTIGQDTLPVGTYAGFRLVIDPMQSSITLKNGTILTGTGSPSIVFPSGSRDGIKIDLSTPVAITANNATTLLVDFNLANSFVLRGNTIMQGGLLFKPVITATVK